PGRWQVCVAGPMQAFLGERPMSGLQVLNEIRIASPCSANWNAMKGDEQVRFCADCGKNVYNLSAITADEGANLLEKTEGRACVRLYRRRDGTVLTSDCPVGVSEARTRRMRFLTRVAAVVSSLWVADTSLRTAQVGPYAPTSRSQSPLSWLREQLTSG